MKKQFKILTFITAGIVLYAGFSLGSVNICRRVRDAGEMNLPPGIKTEPLLRNLYALIVTFSPTVGSNDFLQIFPYLSTLAGANIADHKLSEEEFSQLVENISRSSGKKISLRYETYSHCYDLPSGETFFGDFLPIFKQDFLHILDTSGNMEKAFKFIKFLSTAEYIAGQTMHEWTAEDPLWNERAVQWHKWILSGRMGRDEHRDVLSDYFNWEERSSEDKNTIMACVYILLENKEVKNLSRLITALSQDEVTRSAITEIKGIIQNMYISSDLKSRVLSLFSSLP